MHASDGEFEGNWLGMEVAATGGARKTGKSEGAELGKGLVLGEALGRGVRGERAGGSLGTSSTHKYKCVTAPDSAKMTRTLVAANTLRVTD